jgi:predicted nucleic acid-binding protein
VTEDEPDNRILECAVASGSEFIVAEDKGLLRLELCGDAKIVRARDFLAVVGEG